MSEDDQLYIPHLMIRLRGLIERMDGGMQSLETSLHGAQIHAHGVLREYKEKDLANKPGNSRTFALRFDLENRAHRLRSDTDALKKTYTGFLTDLKEMKAYGEKRAEIETKDGDALARSNYRCLMMTFSTAIHKVQANVDMCAHFDFVISEMEEIAMALD